ncbi:MAG: PEP-CTERM sorting domain-containing protein [Gallionellaceae bacterium]|nr:PEP-CTERM sorting domain-containing protein [Gallionellaceae bacterium]
MKDNFSRAVSVDATARRGLAAETATVKKSVKAMLASLGMAAAIGMFSPSANALAWTLSPDANALAFGVTVVDGVAQIGSADTPGQPAGIFGAGFTQTGTSFSMDFDADLYTWDAYNAPAGTGTGWWDAFVVTVSTVDYYWNLVLSDPVVASASTWVWGGTSYSDDILENYTSATSTTDNISLTSSSPTTFYVSLVLDTKTSPNTDTNHPSWGSFHVNVAPVPEPETYAMLLAGLGLMGFSVRRRNKNT